MNVIPFREMDKIFLLKKTLTEFSVKMVNFQKDGKKVRKWKKMIRELQTFILPNLSSSKVLELTIFVKLNKTNPYKTS